MDEQQNSGKVAAAIKGMTLRDHFAAMALAGGLDQGSTYEFSGSNRPRWFTDSEAIADRAYDIADAMMQHRRKK